MRDEEAAVRHSVDGSPQPKTWLWALILAVVMMVAAALLYFFVVREKRMPPPPPPTQTVTVQAPAPSPKITPSPRESGTPFYDRLPSTVGAFSLVGTAENTAWEELGAFDSYTLTYSNGTDQVTVLAGQWRTDEAAAEAFASLDGAEGWPGPDVDLASKTCPEPTDPDSGAIWVNHTAVFKVDAPEGGAAEFYCRMPM
ncbi:MAG: hypothetical protein LBK95_20710 [Bifidobacteriaceae bacterium]|jgi:hypothetical protein|nr:hypothetical protein [Bifidobacteriaceae bacterium]